LLGAEVMTTNERSYMMNLLRLLTSRQSVVPCGAGCVPELFSEIADGEKVPSSFTGLLIYVFASITSYFREDGRSKFFETLARVTF
jgi:hypothetical protein